MAAVNPIDNDIQKLNEAAEEYKQFIAMEKAIRASMLQKVKNMHGNADAQMLYLSMLLAGGVLPDYEQKIGAMGAGLKERSAMTALLNDIQKITNGDAGMKDGDDVKRAAAALDKLLDGLGMSKDPSKKNPDWLAALGDGVDSLTGDLLSLRQTMYVNGSTSEYQFKKGSDDYNQKVYFDASNPEKLAGFNEMKKDMGEKDQPKRSADAAKEITNHFQTMTASMQSLKAAAKTAMDAETNQYNSIMTATSGYLKAEEDGMKQSIQNALVR
jgi:hypothetical protein